MSSYEWLDQNLSHHSQMAIVSIATQLFPKIDTKSSWPCDPIIPLNGGRRIYKLCKPEETSGGLIRVRRFPDFENIQPVEYESVQKITATYLPKSSGWRKTFTLVGSLTPQTHSILLTAMIGFPQEVLSRQIFSTQFFSTRCRNFILHKIEHNGPDLVDAQTGQPVFGETMSGFIEYASALISH